MDIQQDVVEAVVDSVSPEDVLDDLVGELKVRNYRISRINSIDNIFEREESSSFSFSFKFYKIVEFCNLNSCSELISADLLSGVFMPVRFLVFQKKEESNVHLAFLKPTVFAGLFDSKEMEKIAVQLEIDMRNILDEIRI